MRRDANEELASSLRPQWESVALRAGIDPDTAAFVVVPGSNAQLMDVPEARRDSLRQNLENLLSSTEDDPWVETRPQQFDEAPEAHMAGCAACRGQCCGGGENHGYLRRSDLDRYAASQNLPDAAAAIAHYVERIPEQTMKASCIFHGEVGCTLPRSMRNAICNSMRCSALVDLDSAIAEGAATAVAVSLSPDRKSVLRIGLSSDSHLAVADLEAQRPNGSSRR